jgi:Flp pilus assembly protein TadD
MKTSKPISKTPQRDAASQQAQAKSSRTRTILLGLLALVAIAWLMTLPLRRHLVQETAQLQQQEEASAAATTRQQQTDLALEQARQAVDAAPADMQRRLTYADMLTRAGRPADAETQLHAVLQSAPTNAEAHAALGELYDSQRKEDLAIEEYQRALTLDPHNVLALKNLAFRYVALGWNHPAEALLTRAVQELPNEPRLHIARGLVAFQSRRFDLAEQELLTARRLAPNAPTLYGPLVEVYRHAQRYDDALKTVDQALALNGDKEMLLLERVQIYSEMQDADRTITAADAVLQLDASNIRAHYLRGIALRQKGDLSGAANELEQAYKQDPSFEKVALLLGQVRVQQGQTAVGQKLMDAYKLANQSAQQETQLSLKVMLKPDSPEAHRAIGQRYLADGNAPRAIVEFKRVLVLNPDDAATRELLIRALRNAGRNEEADALAGRPSAPSTQAGR